MLEAARDEETDDGAKTDSFDDIVAELSSTKVNAVLKELVSCEYSILQGLFTLFLVFHYFHILTYLDLVKETNHRDKQNTNTLGK